MRRRARLAGMLAAVRVSGSVVVEYYCTIEANHIAKLALLKAMRMEK